MGSFLGLAHLRRDRWALAGAICFSLILLAAVVGPIFGRGAATDQDLGLRNLPPLSFELGWKGLLGTDPLGRYVIARLLVAARSTLLIAGGATAAAGLIGVVLGVTSGYSGGWRETVTMRIADGILSFPSLLLATVIVYTVVPSRSAVILVLTVTRLPVYIRVGRAETLRLREEEYVQASLALGASSARVVFTQIIPNVVPGALTLATVDMAFVMMIESALTFLGIGIQPPDVTWGLMISQGRNYLASAWWLAFFPGVAIFTTALSLNLLSSWVRIAGNPELRSSVDSGKK